MAGKKRFCSINRHVFVEVGKSRRKKSSHWIRSDSPSPAYSFISIPGYRMNNNYTSLSSAVVCSSSQLSYPLKSIVVSSDGSINGATLTASDGGNTGMNTAKARGPIYIFNNPPRSSCYILNFSSTNSVDMNKLNIQFIYDPTNSTVNDAKRSYESGYDYGDIYNSYASSQNAGKDFRKNLQSYVIRSCSLWFGHMSKWWNLSIYG